MNCFGYLYCQLSFSRIEAPGVPVLCSTYTWPTLLNFQLYRIFTWFTLCSIQHLHRVETAVCRVNKITEHLIVLVLEGPTTSQSDHQPVPI